MQEITKENYKKFLNDFFGIIVAIPKKDLVYNADFYIYGSRVNDKIIFHDIAYNMEDGAINGFSVLNVNLKEEDMFKNFDTMNYYQFDDMTEFCFWYLKQQSLLPEDIYTEISEIGFMPMSDTQIKGLDDFIKQNSTFAELPEELIEKLHSREKRIEALCKKVEDNYNKSEDKKSFVFYEKESIEDIKRKAEKDWIHEKCGTNTPPTTIPEHPSKGNKVRVMRENGAEWISKEEIDEMMFPGHKKRRNKYKDIIELVERIVEYGLQRDTLEKRKKEVGWASFQEPIQKMMDDLDKKYNDWLDEEC